MEGGRRRGAKKRRPLAFMEKKGEEIVRVLFQVAVFVSAVTAIAQS